MKQNDLQLTDKTNAELIDFARQLRKRGYPTIAEEVEEDLRARGVLCTCREIAGDSDDCEIHGGQP